MDSVAAGLLNLRALADGMGAPRQIAERQLEDRAINAQTGYVYTMLQGKEGGISRALFSKDADEYAGNYDVGQMGIAATTIAANLLRTAPFDPAAFYQNLDSLATAIAGRGSGSCDLQLMALISWYANAAVKNGVAFVKMGQMVRRHGWHLGECAPDEEVRKAAEDATNFESSLRAAAYRVNAVHVQVTGTRRYARGIPQARPLRPLFTAAPHQCPLN